MNLIFSAIFLIFLVASLHSVGFYFLKTTFNNKSISVYLLFGLSLLTIFSHFAFHVFDLNPLQIAISFFSHVLLILNFFLKRTLSIN